MDLCSRGPSPQLAALATSLANTGLPSSSLASWVARGSWMLPTCGAEAPTGNWRRTVKDGRCQPWTLPKQPGLERLRHPEKRKFLFKVQGDREPCDLR